MNKHDTGLLLGWWRRRRWQKATATGLLACTLAWAGAGALVAGGGTDPMATAAACRNMPGCRGLRVGIDWRHSHGVRPRAMLILDGRYAQDGAVTLPDGAIRRYERLWAQVLTEDQASMTWSKADEVAQ